MDLTSIKAQREMLKEIYAGGQVGIANTARKLSKVNISSLFSRMNFILSVGVEGLPIHQVLAGVVPQNGVLHIPLHHAHPRHQHLGTGILRCSSRERR